MLDLSSYRFYRYCQMGSRQLVARHYTDNGYISIDSRGTVQWSHKSDGRNQEMNLSNQIPVTSHMKIFNIGFYGGTQRDFAVPRGLQFKIFIYLE
jgi:hypothetical protein